MSPDTKNAACMKDVINSRPEGSFMFPKNVVVEELLEEIDDKWATLWEGNNRN